MSDTQHTVAGLWEAYARLSVPPGETPGAAREVLRRSFYSGAASMVYIAYASLRSDLAPGEGRRMLEAAEAELAGFSDALREEDRA